jgi:hypothetical protein
MRKLSFPGAAVAVLLAACLAPGACARGKDSIDDGHSGMAGSDGSAGSGGADGAGGAGIIPEGGLAGDSSVNPGKITASTAPYDAKTAFDAVRKVKNLLVGLPPTDADVATVEATGAAGLQTLIIGWMTGAATQPYFESKMLFFFTNTFQQTGFTPTVNFQPQLLENGGFDFGPLGVQAVGGDVFAELVQNLQQMFARTAWSIVNAGQPFTNVLTTQQYMMTTGLISLYLQIEMPDDEPYNAAFSFGSKTPVLAWQLNYDATAATATPIADILNPSSAKYMVWDDLPVTGAAANPFGSFLPSCQGGSNGTDGQPHATAQFGGTESPSAPTGGYAQLWQRLLGFTPRWPFLGTPTCWEHPSQPYFSDADMSDWRLVTVTALGSGTHIQPYDIPTIEQTTTLPLALPRIGFYTTPAYLAIWNTNDSNQHRVTTNQTLLAALGESFTSAQTITPVSEVGLDSTHSVTGSQCYGCHKTLDPMRNFWANQFDYNDRNDFPTQTSFDITAADPRPTGAGGVFAFANVNTTGASMLNLGALIEQVTDQNPTNPINQFAESIAEKLCFYANSTACDTTDTEFRQIASDFATGGYNFPSLIKELFSSTLVTGTPSAPDAGASDAGAATVSDDGGDAGVPDGEAPISIVRRTHFCDALSNRTGLADICSLSVPLPNQSQQATATTAGSIPDDNFSRGSQFPVTPSGATLFFRAGIEELCENLAPTLVSTTSTLFPTGDATTAITNMVQQIMGYTPNDPHYAQAIQILTTHQTNATAQSGAAIALESTFVLACESPTSVAIGL